MSGMPPALDLPPDAEGTPFGATRVANDVVAWITALTALQVEGVHAMYRPSGQSIDRILRRRVAHHGVRVALREQGLLIDTWIVIRAGTNVAAVGAQVQKAVADAIERMLGMDLAVVNVYISEVVFT